MNIEVQQALFRVLQTRTQRQLAREAGVSYQHVNDVLSGRRNIPDKLLGYLGFERFTVIRRIDSGK